MEWRCARISLHIFLLSLSYISFCSAIVGAEALTPTSHHLMLGDWRLILEAIHFLLLLHVTHAPYIYVNCSQRSIHARGVVFVCFFSLWSSSSFIFKFVAHILCVVRSLISLSSPANSGRFELEKCAFISSMYDVCVFDFGLECSVFND